LRLPTNIPITMKRKHSTALLERRYVRFAVILALALLPVVITLPLRNPVPVTLVVFFAAVLVSSQFFLPLPMPGLNERVNTFFALLGWLLGLHRASYLIEDVTGKRTVETGMGVFPGLIVVDGHSVVVTPAVSCITCACSGPARTSPSRWSACPSRATVRSAVTFAR
jgi:Na+/proline symporter